MISKHCSISSGFNEALTRHPQTHPQSHISKSEQEQWHKGFFYSLAHWGSDVLPVPKKFMEWLDKQWSDEPTKGHVDGLTDSLTCHR